MGWGLRRIASGREAAAAVLLAACSACGPSATHEPPGAGSPGGPATAATAPVDDEGHGGSAARNLLLNPGFEQGRAPWYALNQPAKPFWADFELSESIVHGGRHAALLPLRSHDYAGPVRIYGVVQDLAPDALPRRLAGHYRVEGWQRGTERQYLQVVVIVWGADQVPAGLRSSNFQIAYVLGGIGEPPFRIENRRFVFRGPREPRQGEWVAFEMDLHADFLEHWGVRPRRLEKLRVLFEVRFDARRPGQPESSADVYYDDLHLGP